MSARETYIEINGVKLARCLNYRLEERSGLALSGSFGESAARAAACGEIRHELEFTRALTDGETLAFSTGGVLTLAVVRCGRRTVYPACTVTGVSESFSGGEIAERVRLVALSRFAGGDEE